MLKAIGWLIKASAFAVIVLIIGNYFRIGNKTISDQVKTQLSHAEQRVDVVNEVKDWAHQITSDQKEGSLKKVKASESPVSRVHARARIAPQPRTVSTAGEEIPSSERQKLRALMRELNSARETN